MHTKRLFVTLALLLITGGLVAQDQEQQRERSSAQQKKEERKQRINALMKQEEEGEVVFNKHTAFNIKLSSDGYGAGLEIGKFISPRNTLLYSFELNEKMHPKENKQGASISQWQVNSVKPGKLYNFYQLKLGVAQQKVIGGKSNKNGVSVSALYGGGLSLGFIKPYYVDVREGFRSTYDKIIDSSYIPLGASGVTVGWGELKFRPGVHAKTGMRFDYGRFNETITAIEVGVAADYYYQKVPQMLFNEEKSFFFAGYVSIVLGRRR